MDEGNLRANSCKVILGRCELRPWEEDDEDRGRLERTFQKRERALNGWIIVRLVWSPCLVSVVEGIE